MSPYAGDVLCTEVVPRLRSAVPAAINFVGCEDAEEVIQNGTANCMEHSTIGKRFAWPPCRPNSKGMPATSDCRCRLHQFKSTGMLAQDD